MSYRALPPLALAGQELKPVAAGQRLRGEQRALTILALAPGTTTAALARDV